jgi:hypothetical protein
LGVIAEGTVGVTNARRRGAWVPRAGERIERWVGGVARPGTVHYSDELQVLVKWDDGSSSSLRVGRDRIYPAS